MSEAAARGLDLIADWVGNGLNAETRTAWEAISEFAGTLAGVSDEHLAEAHTRLLVLEVPPYESVYLSADGLLGGEIAAAVADLRRRSGLSDALENPDHLATELGQLAFLVGAAADAQRDGVRHEHILELQRTLLDEHLLRWVPGWIAALERTADLPAFFAQVGHVLFELLRFVRGQLGGDALPWNLPEKVNFLANPRAGIVDIAEHLTLASQAGGYFARSSLVRIGRSLDIPAGFGSRSDTLEGLFRNAAHYQAVPRLCEALRAELVAWSGRWTGGGAVGEPWLARISETHALLERIARSAPVTTPAPV